MKQYRLHITTLFLSVLFLLGCADENMVEKETVKEGIPTTVKFGFSADAFSEIKTKSQLSETTESVVEDLFVLVFHKEGNDWVVEKSGWIDNGMNATSGSFSWDITSGTKRIFAVANSKVSAYTLSNSLASITTLDEFKALSADMATNDIFRTGALLMCGSYGDTENGEVAIQTESATYDGIKLKRVDSRITFEVSCIKDGAKFTPQEWYVVNVPKKSYVFGRSTDIMSSENSLSEAYSNYYYGETLAKNFEKLSMDARGGGSFTFYMAENMRSALNPISDYQDRERQEKVDMEDQIPGKEENYVENGAFLNVEQEATYVVMTGSYTEGANLRAAVRYTVHLGYVNNVASDFESNRNKAYTYNIKISGVDKIEAEVTTGNEQQPGAEGQIIKSEQLKLVDAHYDIQSMTFDLEKVSAHASFAVKTPYDTDGGYDKKIGNMTAKDYQWVQFLENTDGSTSYQAYPLNGVGLKNIKEVIDDLYERSKTQKGKVVYTVFIDEFYYDKHPDTGEIVSWKDFVNHSNREMHILCNTEYSPDKASSLTTSSFMISQRSIKTFYNVDKVSTAWGIETETEGFKRVSAPDKIKGSASDGYQNMLDEGVVGKSWGNYVVPATNIQTSDAAYTACMQRNRDLNGDGTITRDEVKWYLPAERQLFGYWIGKDALPPDVHIIPNGVQDLISDDSGAKFYSHNYHFITSNGLTFWAEEGSSTSDYKPGSDNKFDYRCVRNLGRLDKFEEYANYGSYVFKLDNISDKSLRGSIINGELSVEDELHTNNLPYKSFQLSKDFANGTLSRADVLNGRTLCDKYQGTNDNYHADAGAWRMPNQREMALICAYAAGNGKEVSLPSNGYMNVISRTKSALATRNASSKYNPGSVYRLEKRNNLYIISLYQASPATARVRCVRDIPLR